MKKIIILTLAVLLGSSTPANAQFFKKLGKALDKIGQVADALNGDETGNVEDHKVGDTAKIGDITLTAYGDNPGVGFKYQGCYRKNGRVLFYFQLPNQGQKDIENVWIRNYEPNETVVYGSNGKKYAISLIVMDNSQSSEGLTKNILAEGILNCALVIDAPATEKKLERVIICSTGQYPGDAIMHNYRFVIKNVTITEMTKED